MKKISLRIQLSAWAVATLCVLASTVQAADQSKFSIPNTQIQALGIQTAPLQSQTGSVKASFPAQVIVPPTAEQVVSSPVQITNEGAAAMRENAALMQRAYALGEAELQDLLLARRQATAAMNNALQAQATALQAYYGLLIDAHLIWELEHD